MLFPSDSLLNIANPLISKYGSAFSIKSFLAFDTYPLKKSEYLATGYGLTLQRHTCQVSRCKIQRILKPVSERFTESSVAASTDELIKD